VFNKIQTYKDHPIIHQLQDIRVAGLLVFGVIVILVSWSGIGAIETNYNLEKQISTLNQQNQLSSLQNNNLELQNQYYNTSEYLELQAREILGKALPGEKLIIVPQNVALEDTVADPTTSSSSISPPKPLYQRNFEAWINFFFHRNVSV
jgi:cell division protein FtsB